MPSSPDQISPDMEPGAASSGDPRSHPSSTNEAPRFPIVGIGASAGGLDALEKFFRSLPEKCGMAFVVILHLSPEHESHLAELLQHHATMPVTEVTETETVAPDHVYIIPPNKNLSLADGQLRLSDLEVPPGRRAPIDQFFRTLARAHGSDAVCIILSGTGSDGTLGLRAIKEHGGLAMAQAPEEAEHEGMPRSAIATGLVDFVLRVKELAEKLIAYNESTATIKLPEQEEALPESDAETLQKIFAQLLARTGHDFSYYKRSTVLRRLTRRLQVNQIPNFPAYLRFLRGHAEEIQALFNDLLICVTNFFRDPEAFEALEKTVTPKLFDGKGPGDQIRVWVAGCATGEEVYSLAMLFVEHTDRIENAPEIQIFATDVSDEAIAAARQGLYPASIAADLSPERLNRFFAKEGGSYRVKKEIREIVLFAVHDLLKAPPFSRLDLITCRNLLIYLNRDVQERVFELFHYALLPGGYLFLGTSESAEGIADFFITVDKKQHIFQRAAVSRLAPHFPPISLGGAAHKATSTDKGTGKKTVSFGALHHHLLERYAPPSLIVNESYDIVHMSDQVGKYLRFVGGEPTANLLLVVREGLQLELRTALFQAFQKNTAAESKWMHVNVGGVPRRMRMIVRPAGSASPQQKFALVIFDEATDSEATAVKEYAADAETTRKTQPGGMNEIVEQLEIELRDTREQLRVTIEQYETSNEELKASNEELQSMNEELKSATEELETSKEELQSTNEELITLNQEHKTKIEELAQANSDLQNLMAATDIGTLFLDRALRIKRFTPRITDLFNITTTDVGRPLAHFTHRLGYDGLLQEAEHVLSRLTPMEREMLSEEGLWYLVHLRPYRSVDDRIEGVVITFVDITARKQSAEALEESRVRAQAILKTTVDAIITIDEQGRIESFNPTAERIFGYRTDEVIGRNVNMLMPSPYHEEHDQYLRNYRETGLRKIIGSEREVLAQRKDGSTFPIDLAVSEVRFNKRRIFTGFIRDITARKQVEKALRESEQRFRTLFENSPDAIFVEDLEGTVLDVNPSACRLHQIEHDALVGKNMTDLVPPDQREAAARDFSRLASGALSYLESYSLTVDHHAVPVEIRASRFTYRGQVVLLLHVRDIVARRQMERQILEATTREQQRIGQDLHDILGSHLTGASMLAQSLTLDVREGKPVSTENLEQVTRLILEGAEHARALARGLNPIKIGNQGLAAALQELADMTQTFSGLSCFIEIKKTPPDLSNELATHLYLIAQEAVNNAVKHAGASAIRMQLITRKDTIVLSVLDDGVGFQEKTKEDEGMGLHVMRYRARSIEAVLTIKTSSGNGTMITCTLPSKKLARHAES